MKILVIPEDQELDRYIVKPVVEALLRDLGRVASVDVVPEPRLRGSGDALNPVVLGSIVRDNPMVDLFLLIVDLDCDRAGNKAKAVACAAEHPGKMIACVARHEIEVWMLALHKAKLPASWRDIRAHCDPKEEFAEPLLEELGSEGPGRGRKKAMRELQGQWKTLCRLCDEVGKLQTAVETWLEGT